MANKEEFIKHKEAAHKLTIEGIVIQFKEPSRHILKIACDKMIQASGGVNMASAGEIIYNSCVIKDDNVKKIEANDTLLNSAWVGCFALIEIKDAKLEKI